MTRRFWTALVTTVIASLVGMGVAPPASAYTPGCTTRSHNYKLGNYADSVTIGSVTLRVNMCWGPGGWFTSTSAVVEKNLNTYGRAAGYTLEQFNPYRTDNLPLPAKGISWRSNGTAQLCFAKVVPICDPMSKYHVSVKFDAPAARGTSGPVNAYGWMAGCNNSACWTNGPVPKP